MVVRQKVGAAGCRALTHPRKGRQAAPAAARRGGGRSEHAGRGWPSAGPLL